MAIELTHNFIRAEGHVPAISFSQWVNTLSAADKAEFDVAAAKHKAIMDAEKASGNLISEAGFKQVWRDGPVAPHPDWKVFFDRYLAETNTSHSVG